MNRWINKGRRWRVESQSRNSYTLEPVFLHLGAGSLTPWSWYPYTLEPVFLHPGAGILTPWSWYPYTPWAGILTPWIRYSNSYTLELVSLHPGTGILTPWSRYSYTLYPVFLHLRAGILTPWSRYSYTLDPVFLHPGAGSLTPNSLWACFPYTQHPVSRGSTALDIVSLHITDLLQAKMGWAIKSSVLYLDIFYGNLEVTRNLYQCYS